jgi:hypothetical protein
MYVFVKFGKGYEDSAEHVRIPQVRKGVRGQCRACTNSPSSERGTRTARNMYIFVKFGKGYEDSTEHVRIRSVRKGVREQRGTCTYSPTKYFNVMQQVYSLGKDEISFAI